MAEKTLTDAEKFELASFLGEFTHDPAGFVWAAFPWGDGELAGMAPQKWQIELLDDIRDGLKTPDQVIQEAVASGHGIGKAQDVDSEIYTPTGVCRMADISEGSYVFGVDGKPQRVTGVPYEGKRPCFKVTFDDRTSVVVSQEHLWTVRGRNGRRGVSRANDGWEVLETKEILTRGVKRKNGHAFARQWEIPKQRPVQFEHKKNEIEPYLMGLLIGDGCCASGRISTSGEEIAERLHELGIKFCKRQRGDNCYDVYAYGTISYLRKNKLDSCRSNTKYIPDYFKYTDVESRKELLRGLIDTDGEVNTAGSIVYSTVSSTLKDDILWLARSLGCKATMQPTQKQPFFRDSNGNKKRGQACYRITISLPDDFGIPCYVQKKSSRVHKVQDRYITRWIDSIEYVGERDTKCISVENQDGLYLTNDFVATHNSALVSWLILWAISTFEDTKGIVTANTDTQLRTKTWAELAKWHRLFVAKDLFVYTATSYYSADKSHEKTWRVDAIPWSDSNPEAFAGMHNQGKRVLVVFDEASAVADSIWDVIEGATTDKNTEILWCVFGNPTRNSGRFYECFHKFRNFWRRKQIDSRNVAISNQVQLNKWVDMYGIDSDFVRVRVCGLFPKAASGQLISSELVSSAIERYKSLTKSSYDFAPVIIGCDPAWTGDDKLVVYMRQGNYSKILLEMPKNDDDSIVAGKLAAFQDEYGMSKGFIDQGYGTGIYSALKSMGRGDKWELIPFSSSPNNDYYQNKRAEMWHDLKNWLKDGGCIEDNQDISTDLTGPEAFINRRGKMQLESKDDMKARGVASPNYADALALTFAQPVITCRNDRFEKLRMQGKMRKYGGM